MALMDFRSTHFIYCLQPQDDGTYLPLNREYMALGFTSSTEFNKAMDEGRIKGIKFIGLGPKKIKKLSVDDNGPTGYIYLYHDGLVPTRSKANMDAYLEKLAALAKMQVRAADGSIF